MGRNGRVLEGSIEAFASSDGGNPLKKSGRIAVRCARIDPRT
jgi:hypothetical protein